jgi:hypothetical protein
VPAVYIQLAGAHFFDELSVDLEASGWLVERLQLGHLAPVTDPAEVSDALVRHIP